MSKAGSEKDIKEGAESPTPPADAPDPTLVFMSPIATEEEGLADPQGVLQLTEAQKGYMQSLFNDFLLQFASTDRIPSSNSSDNQGDVGNTALLAAAPDQTVFAPDETLPPIDPVETRAPLVPDPNRRNSIFDMQWADTARRVSNAKPPGLTQFVQQPPLEERRQWELRSLSLKSILYWIDMIQEKKVQHPTMTILLNHYVKNSIWEELYNQVVLVEYRFPDAPKLIKHYEGNAILSITDDHLLKFLHYAKVPSSKAEFLQLFDTTISFKSLPVGFKYDIYGLPLLINCISDYLRQVLNYHRFLTQLSPTRESEILLDYIPLIKNKENGYIKAFLDNIPFNCGKALFNTLNPLDLDKVKVFEDFSTIFKQALLKAS
jgi:hypothetical protein